MTNEQFNLLIGVIMAEGLILLATIGLIVYFLLRKSKRYPSFVNPKNSNRRTIIIPEEEEGNIPIAYIIKEPSGRKLAIPIVYDEEINQQADVKIIKGKYETTPTQIKYDRDA